jgi:hypothetical protein
VNWAEEGPFGLFAKPIIFNNREIQVVNISFAFQRLLYIYRLK